MINTKAILIALVLSLPVVALATPTGSEQRQTPAECPVTWLPELVASGTQADANVPQTRYGEGPLQVSIYPSGVVQLRADNDSNLDKFAWFVEDENAGLEISAVNRETGERIKGHVSSDQTGIVSSTLSFPSLGCWTITGTSGDAKLSFTVMVIKGG